MTDEKQEQVEEELKDQEEQEQKGDNGDGTEDLTRVMIVFKGPDSVLFDVQTTRNLMPGQLFALGHTFLLEAEETLREMRMQIRMKQAQDDAQMQSIMGGIARTRKGDDPRLARSRRQAKNLLRKRGKKR